MRNLDNTNYIRPALLGITESKLDGFVMNAEINNGYSIIRNDRNRNGGGVACYIRKNLFFSNSTEHVFSRNSHSRSSHTIFKILIPFSIFFFFLHTSWFANLSLSSVRFGLHSVQQYYKKILKYPNSKLKFNFVSEETVLKLL